MSNKVILLGMVSVVTFVASAWTHSPASKEIGVNGGSFTLTVSGTEYYDWSAGALEDWITVTRVNGTTFTVTVAPNETSEERVANVTISAFQGGSQHSAQTFVNLQNCGVRQSAHAKPSVSPIALSFSKEGGTATVDVVAASGDEWDVDESLDWVTTSLRSGKGSRTVTVTAQENTGYLPRTGYLIVAGKEIKVSQSGEPGYSRVVYVNLRGAENPNPDYYREGEELCLIPLGDIDGYRFAGWTPAMIEENATGTVEIVANWQSTNYCGIVDVEARQRYPWNGKVDVSYLVVGDVQHAACESGYHVTPTLFAEDLSSGLRYEALDVEGELSIEEGRHSVVWDMERQGLYLHSSNVVFHLMCERKDPAYCVVDLSLPEISLTSRVTYLDSFPTGGWADDYKISKLVMRRIEPGSFLMQGTVPTKISGPYYMAVFEFTEGQNAKLRGLESLSKVALSGVTYNGIRGKTKGAEWPNSGNVDSGSIIDLLRSRTGLELDLPTEAQWENAYRAGTETVYPWGDEDPWDPESEELARIACRYAWYTSNATCVHEVGTRLPNGWGLYDMGGNVCEWCLDRYGDKLFGGLDPVGPLQGQYRVSRGGFYGSYEWELESSYRRYGDPSITGGGSGFRVAWTLPPDKLRLDDLDGISQKVVIDTETVTHAPLITALCQEAGSLEVTIEWENDWPIYYTIDGSVPTPSSNVYADMLKISNRGSKILKAVAISPDGSQSEVATLEIHAPNPPTISPANGTIIDSSVSVNIASDNPNATIYCTTDGTEPTTDSPVYSRFKASKKMTVKAIAVVEGMAWSETATAEYALDRCADPVITPADGTVFSNSNYQVAIDRNGEKGVLHYTIDGSDPTEASPIYAGPFTVNVTTTVKAKTFDPDCFDSAIVSATLTRHWTKVANPIIVAAERFSGTKTSVSLACETAGAVIRYTTDGSEPNSHSPKYTGMFEVTTTTVVKAIAVMADCENSDVVSWTITKEWGVGDALNDPDRSFLTDNNAGWVRDTAVSHDGSEAMRSGAIANSAAMGVYSTSSLSTVVDGKGVVRFFWKASCEEDEDFEWDHGEFQVDGVTVARINGETAWGEMSCEITTDGDHIVSWCYFKDDFGSEGNDCIWVDEFSWTPTPPAVLQSLAVEGEARIVDGRETGYSCTAYYDDGTSAQVSPLWAVVSGNDCVTIDPSGVLSAKKVGNAVVSATYTDAGVTKTATLSVTIVKGVSAVEIAGPASVYAGDSAVYSCLAMYTDGSEEAVNADWTLTSGSGCAGLNSTGTLTALDADGTAMIKATFTYEGETKTATYPVVVSRQILVDAEVTGCYSAFVPVSWVNQYPMFRTLYGNDLVAAMAMLTGKKDGSGKQLNVWHDYVAGTDPTDVNDVFQAIIEIEDGLPKVGWRPNLNEKGEVRTYKVYGRHLLSNEDSWEYPANSAEHQFFKVDVSMPGTGDGGSDSPGVIEAWKFVALPTAVSGLVYDGTAKQGVLQRTGYTLSGASATGAGNYTAVATLASGFKWEGGSQANQQIPWSIAKANNAWVSAPTMSATTFLSGSAVTVTDGVSKFGTVTRNYSDSAIQSLSAGSYTLVSTVTGTANYTGLTHSIPFTVTAPATKIALPTAKTGLVYTGGTQTGVATGTGYTLSGNTGVNAGTYTATATLESGYEWSDGELSQSREISWSIAKATNSWLTEPSLSSTEFAEGSSVTISFGSSKFGVKQVNYTAAELAQLTAGSYTLEVSVVETDNYTGLTKSISFTVTEASKEVSGVSVSPTSLTMNDIGATAQLVATVLPETALNKGVTWSTSDSSVVTVVDGLVTSVGLGSATVTVMTQEGGFAKNCSVTVASTCISSGDDSDISNIKLYSGSSYPKSGNDAWSVQGSQAYAGSKALRSGNRVSRSYDSYFGSVVYGSGTISFWWKVSSSSADKLRFYIEGDSKAEISGVGGGWQKVSLRIEGAYAHRIRWVYNNYNTGVAKAGEDCGWVDCVEWSPDSSTANPPARIEISGNDSLTPRTYNKTYTGTLYFQSGSQSSMSSYNQVQFGTCAILPIWSIDETNIDVTINPYSGEVSLNGDYTGQVTVRATYTANGVSVSGTKAVLIGQ